jgi:hypothetical protein
MDIDVISDDLLFQSSDEENNELSDIDVKEMVK